MRACLCGVAAFVALVAFSPTPPAQAQPGFQFAGIQINGIEVGRVVRRPHHLGRFRRIASTDFLSPANLCNALLSRRGEIEQRATNEFRAQAQGRLPGGFGTHSQTRVSLSNNCNARAEVLTVAGGNVTIVVRLIGNSVRVRITTPSGFPGALDPVFRVTFDAEIRVVVAVPTHTSQRFAQPDQRVTASNISPLQPVNVPAAAVVAFNGVADVLLGRPFLRQFGGDITFNQTVALPLNQINTALNGVPPAFLNHSVVGDKLRLTIASAPPAPFFPPLH